MSAGRGVELEVTVDSPAGVAAAHEGGADRVELCASLELGGLTPSPGALARSLEAAGGALGVHVLVRPRPGGFVYDADELATALRDVEAAAAAGAAGVVVGALRDDGGRLALHAAFLAEAAQRARAASPLGAALEVVLHRAVDQLLSVAAAVPGLADLGIGRVLTSGGAPRAVDGLAELGRAAAAGRACGVEVMAGAGVRPEQVAALVGAGVHAVHLSARRPAPSSGGARSLGSRVPVGTADDGGHAVTDAALVSQVRAALDALP